MTVRRQPLPRPSSGFFSGEGVDRNQLPDIDALLGLIARPRWHAEALCRDPKYARVNFYPERGEDLEPARQVCAGCAVAEECADYAIAHKDRHGVWGGMSARERNRRARPAA